MIERSSGECNLKMRQCCYCYIQGQLLGSFGETSCDFLTWNLVGISQTSLIYTASALIIFMSSGWIHKWNKCLRTKRQKVYVALSGLKTFKYVEHVSKLEIIN